MSVFIKSTITVSFEITTKDQAEYLIATMQNNILGATPSSESPQVAELRKGLFEAARQYALRSADNVKESIVATGVSYK